MAIRIVIVDPRTEALPFTPHIQGIWFPIPLSLSDLMPRGKGIPTANPKGANIRFVVNALKGRVSPKS
jgi:hypothetical protein